MVRRQEPVSGLGDGGRARQQAGLSAADRAALDGGGGRQRPRTSRPGFGRGGRPCRASRSLSGECPEHQLRAERNQAFRRCRVAGCAIGDRDIGDGCVFIQREARHPGDRFRHRRDARPSIRSRVVFGQAGRSSPLRSAFGAARRLPIERRHDRFSQHPDGLPDIPQVAWMDQPEVD